MTATTNPATSNGLPFTEQNRNKRSNIRVIIDGTTRTLKEWCDLRGLPYRSIHYRVKAGEDPLSAMSRPINSSNQRAGLARHGRPARAYVTSEGQRQ